MKLAIRLSKSKFTAGLQCHRQLWWKVHEPDAPELVPDVATRKVLDQGTRVGELARGYVPGGTLIDLPHDAFDARLAATRAASSTARTSSTRRRSCTTACTSRSTCSSAPTRASG